MKAPRHSSGSIMRKYYQLILVIVCFISIVLLLIYRHEYYRLRYVLEVLNFFGKPGLSEIEFCGPGFNATMLSEIMRNSSMEVRETPPLFQQIDENFYSYSSFSRSYRKTEPLTPYIHNIHTIVIGKAEVDPNFRCNLWLENSVKPNVGRFSYKIVSEPINGYRLYVFDCALNRDLGNPRGVSFYKNDYNVNPIHAPINGAVKLNTKQRSNTVHAIRFINNIEPAICVIPNRIPIVSRNSFIEFLVFHHMMGINYFTIYDSMISEDVIRRLNLLPTDITQWNIQFFPLNYPFVFSKSYEIVRSAIELDCLFRYYRSDKEELDKASHAIIMSWDEFLVPRIENDLKAVIDDFRPLRQMTATSITVKTLVFCLNQEDDDESEMGYPDIMKKTHYYQVNTDSQPVYIRNLNAMTTFDDIYDVAKRNISLPLEVLGTHKYTECRDPKRYHPTGAVYNETQMQVFQHKFEGAMKRFATSLMNNKIYRLYTSGQIWEKTNNNENVRDML